LHESERAQTPNVAEAQETEPSPAEANGSPSPSDSLSEGEYSGSETDDDEPPSAPQNRPEAQPPLPNEPLPRHGGPPLPNEPLPSTNSAAPPLPAEPVPEQADDGWEFHWNPNDQSYWFYNRFTGAWQQENPRLTEGAPATTTTAPAATAAPAAPGTTDTKTGTGLSNPTSVAGGYNPAIHGSYDENAWYAQNLRAPTADPSSSTAGQQQPEEYTSAGFFNKHTGQWQDAEQGTERHTDEAKSRRQMRAYFDVDAAANMHDGRSLKAERSGKKPSRSELKAFKERRKAKKEEKRRAWLRD
jgi:hypothetical protein